MQLNFTVIIRGKYTNHYLDKIGKNAIAYYQYCKFVGVSAENTWRKLQIICQPAIPASNISAGTPRWR